MSIKILDRERKKVGDALKVGGYVVGVLWALHILRWLLGLKAGSFGIMPRMTEGVMGILTGPLVHGDFGHLTNNSIPIFATVVLLFYFFPKLAGRAMLQLYVLTGIAVWLLARGAGWGADVTVSHIGASGVAYALVSFLFWFGVFQRSMQSIVVALVIITLFTGMIAGIFPNDMHISWESHLLGGIVGIIVAYSFRNYVAPKTPREDNSYNFEYQSKPYFSNDAFVYTKAEREAIRLAAIEAERRRIYEEQLRLGLIQDVDSIDITNEE